MDKTIPAQLKLLAVAVVAMLLAVNAAAEGVAPSPVITTAAERTAQDTVKFSVSFGIPIDLATFSLADISISVGVAKNLAQRYEGTTSIAGGELSQPQGVAVRDGNIYTVGAKSHVVRVTGANVLTLGTGTPGSGTDQFHYPHGVAVDAEGNIYVADTSNHRIQVFNGGGAYRRTIGSGEGAGDEQFNAPYGVAVDEQGNVYVADSNNHRIKVFSGDGEYLQTIGSSMSFKYPQNIEVDSIGNVRVMDTGNNRVQVMQLGNDFDFSVGGLAVGDTLTVNIPAGAVQDLHGNPSTASNVLQVQISDDLAVVSATTNDAGDTIILGMSEEVAGGGSAMGFAVRSATHPMVTNVEVSAANSRIVILALSQPVTIGETILLDYARTDSDLSTRSAPVVALGDFTARQVSNVMAARENAKRLNEVIVPRLVQTIIASNLAAIEGRVNVASAGNSATAGYTVGSAEINNLNASVNTVMNDGGGEFLQGMVMDEAVSNDHANLLERGLFRDTNAIINGEVDWRRALLDSSFVMPLSANVEPGNSGLVLWGRGDYSDLGGDSDQVNWDGDVVTYQLGTEARRKNILLGGLISRSEGKFDYKQEVVGNLTERGEYNLAMTNINPYISWLSADGTDIYGTLGIGQGDLEIAADGIAKRTSDVDMWSLAAGAKKQLSGNGNSKMAFKSDIALARTTIKGNDRDNIAKQGISSHRLRGLIEVSHAKKLGAGRLLTPSTEAGLRWDGGAGEDRIGFDLSAGLRYQNENSRLISEGSVRLADNGDAREWGISGSLSIEPTHGHGLKLKLQPDYGNTSSGAERIWQQAVHDDTNRQEIENTMRMGIYISYGMVVFLLGNDGLLTPYSEAILGGSANSYHLGINFAGLHNYGLSLKAEHQEQSTTRETNNILLQIKILL